MHFWLATKDTFLNDYNKSQLDLQMP